MPTLNEWITAHRDTDGVSKENFDLARENELLGREICVLNEARELLKKATLIFTSPTCSGSDEI